MKVFQVNSYTKVFWNVRNNYLSKIPYGEKSQIQSAWAIVSATDIIIHIMTFKISFESRPNRKGGSQRLAEYISGFQTDNFPILWVTQTPTTLLSPSYL